MCYHRAHLNKQVWDFPFIATFFPNPYYHETVGLGGQLYILQQHMHFKSVSQKKIAVSLAPKPLAHSVPGGV